MFDAAKILITDDNPDVHEIMRRTFESPGDTGTAAPLLFHADNGQAALDVLAGNPDIDVIVLDLMMPVMDGFEFLVHVKNEARFRSIPICVLSGSRDESTKALNLGARDFIIKPGNHAENRLRILNLIQNKRQVETSERAKVQFLAAISHELRTPMSGVIGMTQLLRTTELTGEQSGYVKYLEQSAIKMMTLVDDVFAFLESENPFHHLPKTPFSLRAIIQELIDTLASDAAKSGVSLSVDIHPDLPDTLSGLPDKIQMIFRHLMGNAIKFSPAGKVRLCIEPGTQEAGTVQLRCSVADSGVGIPPDMQKSVFEPFTQADGSFSRKFGGLGIGLSIASRMVQMMGSALKVESNANGSTFSFSLTCDLDVSASV